MGRADIRQTTAVTTTRTPNHTVYLTRGLPGSGRTTLAQKLAGPTGLVICPEDGIPADLKSELKAADLAAFKKALKGPPFTRDHNAACVVIALQQLRKHLLAQRPTDIVVERPHIQLWEMRAAVRLALKHSYRVKIVPTTTKWAQDGKKCLARTHHKVAPHVMAEMETKFEPGATVAKVLRSLTPSEKLTHCEMLWNGLEFLSLPEKKRQWRLIQRDFAPELALLTAKHGLLREHGWPRTSGEIGYLAPVNP